MKNKALLIHGTFLSLMIPSCGGEDYPYARVQGPFRYDVNGWIAWKTVEDQPHEVWELGKPGSSAPCIVTVANQTLLTGDGIRHSHITCRELAHCYHASITCESGLQGDLLFPYDIHWPIDFVLFVPDAQGVSQPISRPGMGSAELRGGAQLYQFERCRDMTTQGPQRRPDIHIDTLHPYSARKFSIYYSTMRHPYMNFPSTAADVNDDSCYDFDIGMRVYGD